MSNQLTIGERPKKKNVESFLSIDQFSFILLLVKEPIPIILVFGYKQRF